MQLRNEITIMGEILCLTLTTVMPILLQESFFGLVSGVELVFPLLDASEK